MSLGTPRISSRSSRDAGCTDSYQTPCQERPSARTVECRGLSGLTLASWGIGDAELGAACCRGSKRR